MVAAFAENSKSPNITHVLEARIDFKEGCVPPKHRPGRVSPAAQAIIDEHSGPEFSAMAGKQMQADDEASRVAAAELGNNIIKLSEDEVQAWRDASQATIDEWIEEMDGEGVGGTELFEKASALIIENAGQ